MSRVNDTYLALEIALARYRHGKCPCCGKGLGELKGLEYRRKSGDIYCHTCRRPWPPEMDADALRVELALSEFLVADVLSLPAHDEEPSPLPGVVRRLSNFVKAIILKR